MQRSLLLAICCLLLVAGGACGSPPAARQVAAASSASRADRSWIGKAHQANMAEMAAGELAESKGGSEAIRSAGAMLYRDHAALDTKMIAAANALHLVLPTHQTLQQTLTGDRLSNEEGHLFDHDFTGTMISAHQSMIAATRAEIAHGSSPAVVSLARQALPALIRHLKAMKAAAASG